MGAGDEGRQLERLRQELEASRRRLAMLDSMIEGVVLFDDRRRIRYANAAHAFIHGYDGPDQLLGRDWSELYAADEITRLDNEMRSPVAGGEGWTGTIEARRRDGTLFEQQLSLRLLDSGSWVCTCRDIASPRRAKRALRQEQSRLRTVVSGAPLVLWALNADGVFTLAEGRETSALGLLPGELVGKSVFEVYGDVPQIVDNVRCALCGDTVSYVAEIAGRIFDTQFCPVKDAAGAVQGVIGVATDVTERTRTERTLHETSERLQSVISHAPVVLWATDAEGRFTLSEGKGLDSLGLKPGEVVGRSIFETYGDVPEVLAAAWRALGGETFRATFDVAGRTYESLYAAVSDADGEIAGMDGISIDITERRQAERALRASEEKYREIFNAATVSLCEGDIGRLLATLDALREKGVTDLRAWLEDNPEFVAGAGQQVEVLDVNDETMRMFAATDKAQILRSVDRILDPQSLVVAKEALIALYDGRESFAGEAACHNLRGERVDAIVKLIFPQKDSGSTRMLINVIDISERVRAEEMRRDLERQVRHAQKLESLGVLAGGIAHDFNNILSGILGNAELALFDLPPQSKVGERLHNVISASSRAAELCRQMLAYSGKGKFEIRPLSVNRVVREMTSLLEVAISKRTVLEFDLDPDLPPIDADPAQIRQVAMNLITNASESIEECSGQVTVATGVMDCDEAYLRGTYLDDELPPGRYVFLEVRDTGQGMDKQTRATMFDPFFTTKFTGRGLGLAATLGIVRGHRGAIAIDSEPAQGTIVRVLFPRSDGEHAATPARALPLRRPKGSRLILVVDDEEPVRDVSRRALELAGYKVLTAADGPEAVDVFRKYHETISVVVLDLTMPQLGGEETLRQLRRIRDDVCVILTSGYNEAEATGGFGDRAPAGFIQKPFTLTAFLSKLRDVVDES